MTSMSRKELECEDGERAFRGEKAAQAKVLQTSWLCEDPEGCWGARAQCGARRERSRQGTGSRRPGLVGLYSVNQCINICKNTCVI